MMGSAVSLKAYTFVMSLSGLHVVRAGKEVEETLRVVDAQTKEAAAKKQVVEGEEAIAADKAAAAKAIKVRLGGRWLGQGHSLVDLWRAYGRAQHTSCTTTWKL